MIRKDLTIRYACGSYWIISTDVHLYADASYHAPVMTNETGYHIWICLKKHFSIEETVETISGLYHISYENALQDTKEFILLLKQNGCMEGL